MGQQKISLRHIQIDKSNTIIVVATATAAACLVFSLVAVQALWGQARYNSKVIKAKENTVTQLTENIDSLDQLKTSYQAFVSEPTNIIGGVSTGTGDRDGDNAKITLDAMPSVYDFPGMVSGFTKVLTGKSFSNPAITGNDEEAAQAVNVTPEIVELPLSFSGSGSPEGVQELVTILDNSIRPVKVDQISFSGDDTGLTVNIDGKTYFQPKKDFQVKVETIK